MLETIHRKSILDEMIDHLDLPEYVMEKTVQRYKSLGDWFRRENCSFKDVEIDIFPQGSFALGTTIKPLNDQEEYDLDMGCKINIPNFKSLYSQEQLKEMVGFELERYRVAKGIKQELEEKHRCWRLEYMDEIKFHLDILPCIPLNNDKQADYKKVLEGAFNYKESLNNSMVHVAINITDDRIENYKKISQDWNISNPEGYLKWFEDRMTTCNLGLYSRSSVTPVPIYYRKTILKRCIQLLKRHRDNMFGENDSKPISIIITTLAARAYNGELNLEEAMVNLLENMPRFINTSIPRVPNPVNPNEDFTDRWDTPEGKKLNLEGNLKNWLLQARADFNNLLKTTSYETASLILNNKFSLKIDNRVLNTKFNLKSDKKTIATSLPKNPPKPWGDTY
ncbi:nucleotidyltransferase (plasmid) [Cytobacillus oceanisediminis]|uniref:nucleotidyltransferase domain-containing protein n=1 Tax=Cytobacillus oceanisediminis TaxID=665099 RepID=UPI001863D146|nr:nucleotidyltransferase [Cytobacillus oceanisediminis]QOK30039.1 nucleotidyltransferase [Cytobacillus oceanisediminis]